MVIRMLQWQLSQVMTIQVLYNNMMCTLIQINTIFKLHVQIVFHKIKTIKCLSLLLYTYILYGTYYRTWYHKTKIRSHLKILNN